MIRTDRFLISKRLYAVDLASVNGQQHPRGDRDTLNFSGSASAVWFRRKDGVTRACLGTLHLWTHHLPAPLDLADPHAILSADLDGRYGGTCHARWDGARYWGAQEPHQQALDLTVLEPMLAAYPAIPDGYDGWWRF